LTAGRREAFLGTANLPSPIRFWDFQSKDFNISLSFILPWFHANNWNLAHAGLWETNLNSCGSKISP
jgi:hypothetical protein